jgi:orotidine-5'-phosphate decarboxylase
LDRDAPPALDPVQRVIPALDTDDLVQACKWVEKFQGRTRLFKVGSQLFTSAGPSCVEAIRGRGGQVFLDLKFHDIPNTVKGAVAAAVALGVTLLNVHGLGGEAMIRSAVDAAHEEAERRGTSAPKVLAVTILTSLGDAELELLGLSGGVEKCVLRLAETALQSGADGLIASPREVRALRERWGKGVLLVTPGIRLVQAPSDDQKRIMGPKEALDAGADFLVMGRSLLEAPDPVTFLEEAIG